jgi:hypothetical protein
MQGRQEVARNSRAGDGAIGSEGPNVGVVRGQQSRWEEGAVAEREARQGSDGTWAGGGKS